MVLAAVTVELLEIIGLMFAGGVLLLWVCWKLWRDIRRGGRRPRSGRRAGTRWADLIRRGEYRDGAPAIVQIAAADLSMSLDNVLAVAGAARNHVVVLAIGLCLSIGLMGVAASVIAKLLNKHAWISYAGLFIVLYVAISMIWRGGFAIMHAM